MYLGPFMIFLGVVILIGTMIFGVGNTEVHLSKYMVVHHLVLQDDRAVNAAVQDALDDRKITEFDYHDIISIAEQQGLSINRTRDNIEQKLKGEEFSTN